MAAHAAGGFVTATPEFKRAQDAIHPRSPEYWLASSLDKADPEQKKKSRTGHHGAQNNHQSPGQRACGADKVDETVKLASSSARVASTAADGGDDLARWHFCGDDQPESKLGVKRAHQIERPAGNTTVEATVEGITIRSPSDVTRRWHSTWSSEMNTGEEAHHTASTPRRLRRRLSQRSAA